MPDITFIQANGDSQKVDAQLGQSLMQVATDHAIEGIVGECGGAAMCATCHVYVEAAWLEQIPNADSNEFSMLDFTASERQHNSRLSCQIRVTQALDGLVVNLPAAQ
jgi:2Fe-2S ferredoxin